MLYFFLTFINAQENQLLFVRDLVYSKYEPKVDTNYSLLFQPFFKSLFVLNYKSSGVKITYNNLFDSKGESFNLTIPAKIFEFTTGRINFLAPAGSTIAFTTFGYGNSLCKGPIEVITKPEFQRIFTFDENEISQEGYERCILHAPAGTGIQYEITNTNLGNAVLSIYDDHDSSLPIDSFYDKYQSSWSTTSDHPLLYRLKLDMKDGQKTHTVTLNSKVIDSQANAIIYQGTPELYNATSIGALHHKAIFPILGCMPAILLICAWCFSFCILSRKSTPSKPVQMNVNLP